MQSLENHFLIAMPSMQDPFFKRAVTYICEHNEDGAMGLVINQPIDVTVGELLDKIEIDNDKTQQQRHRPNRHSHGPNANEKRTQTETAQKLGSAHD